MSLRIEIADRAERDLDKLPPNIHRRVCAKISLLADDPHPPHSSRKLSYPLTGYRLRVGDYRVFYVIDDQESAVVIYAVRHRREAYR